MADLTETPTKRDEEQGSGSSISDFLQAPRKKRKNYVIFALGDDFDTDLGFAMEGFVKKAFTNLAVSTPSSPPDLLRQFGRNISLLVISDEFSNHEEVMEIVLNLKTKRHSETIPVLFLTRNPERLVEEYHSKLLQYQESDEYVFYPNASMQQIFGRIKLGIETKNKRRSRRYKINQPVRFFHLQRNQNMEGRLLDLSAHGALLETTPECLFKIGDQLRINIPVGSANTGERGDFLKIGAKVRRVFISGCLAGISFEYMSESQIGCLTRFLTQRVTKEMERKSSSLRHPAPKKSR